MVINVDLSVFGINNAINQIDQYANELQGRIDIFLERLAEVGLKEASFRFTTALYDGLNDSQCSMKPIKNGWQINANGKAVAFIEFGTGVTHSRPYPIKKPAGIVDIGQWGKKQGQHKGWVYRGVVGSNGRYLSNVASSKDTDLVYTQGNPPNMCMYYATREMQDKILEIAREVFK